MKTSTGKSSGAKRELSSTCFSDDLLSGYLTTMVMLYTLVIEQ
jgi:hypothetical protein